MLKLDFFLGHNLLLWMGLFLACLIIGLFWVMINVFLLWCRTFKSQNYNFGRNDISICVQFFFKRAVFPVVGLLLIMNVILRLEVFVERGLLC